MTDIAVDLSEYSIQIICPGVHVSTGAAFAMMQPSPAVFDLHMLPSLPVAQWKEFVSNDFEGPVFSRHPLLADIKQHLYDQGALYASMSGSGSSIYGILPKGERSKAGAGLQDFYLE